MTPYPADVPDPDDHRDATGAEVPPAEWTGRWCAADMDDEPDS